jgi:hypothetical protein
MKFADVQKLCDAGLVTVQAVVSASGRASFKQVFLNGVPYAEAMKGMAR